MKGQIVKLRNGVRLVHKGDTMYEMLCTTHLDTGRSIGPMTYNKGEGILLITYDYEKNADNLLMHKGGAYTKDFDVVEVLS